MALRCCLVVVKFRQLLRRKRAGILIVSFANQLLINRNLGVEVMIRLKQIRLIQRCVKRWYFQECVRKQLLRTSLEGMEADILRKSLSEDDMALIKREQARLKTIRAANERKTIERTLAVTRHNYQRLRNPKNEADLSYMHQLLDGHRMPASIVKCCANHAWTARKRQMDAEMKQRHVVLEAYAHEVQTWQDIEQAVQLIDPVGHNPALRPEPPEFRRLPFLLPATAVRSLVRKVRQWYEDIVKDTAPKVHEELKAGQPVPAHIGVSLREICQDVVLQSNLYSSRPGKSAH